MMDFLRVSRRLLEEGAPVSRSEFDLVLKLRTELERLHARSENDLRNLESIFNLVEMGSLLNLLPGVKAEDIPQASAAIRKVLAETI
jgi:hypothetical protein